MGRSKFPGKPSKHLNRTRINVLSTVVNTTVGDNNLSVVTVVESDDSKKVEKEDVKEDDDIKKNKADENNPSEKLARKCKKTRLSPSKCPPLKRTIIRSNFVNSPVNTSTRLTRSKVSRRSVRAFSGIRKLTKSPKKEPTNQAGKFVLPSRSVHSSRVIKPNKRFLNVDQNDTRIIKTKFIPKRQNVKSNSEVDCDKTDNDKADNESPKKEVNSTQESPSNGKIVLRQARLQIKSKISMGTEGPFSKNVSNISSPQGNVSCGVCGAVRYYRFIKQARKFNIYSCEACRKFISMLIRRVNNKTETALHCHIGQGLCHVPPILKNQSKVGRTVNNSRCSACWLKLCLRSFQMPLILRTNLSQLLPKSMQINDKTFGTTLPLMMWQSNMENNSTLLNNTELNVRQRPVRLKPVKKIEKTPSPPVNNVRRQIMDFKGPRVKHVCRSASIVLGQIPATFPLSEKKSNEVIEKEKDDKIINNDDTNSKTANASLPEITIPVVRIAEKEISLPKSEPKGNEVFIPTKREKSKISSLLPIEITKPSFSKRTKKVMLNDNLPRVDIDFWETYDPDEIMCNGFSIVSSESFPMQAICFLCGSAGKETLLHCCICCEPYHPYCLEQGPPNFLNTNQKYTWVCPKCTSCTACGESDRQKINCQKCHKSYHPQCFNTKWRTDDRPTVCSNCLRCKSCGTDNITKFVGNLALCLLCFKLRNKGNYCPLCQCCYDDNDFDTKMMECGKCNKWVHAKCEGLSDEQYQILSILPETVEFQCCLCSNESTPYWRKAVQTELRSCFNNILRLLSKNKLARDTFKLSPLKMLNPEKKRLSSARRLQFLENDESPLSMEAESSLDSDLEQVNLILNQKQDVENSFIGNSPTESKLLVSPNMVEIRNKLNCNEYFSLRDFNNSMEQALKTISSDELFNIYKSILKKVFPWFDPNLKEELNQSICDTPFLEKCDEKQFSFDVFDPQSFNCIDTRMCNLCKGTGDGLAHKESRLLYCGQNDWIHANCALWSSEVYEEIDGSLQNVQSAVTHGRSLRCSYCRQKGASVGCCLKSCHETYHFPCAIKAQSIFFADKTIFCHSHSIGDKTNVLTNPRDFEIRRTIYIEIDSKRRKSCVPNMIKVMVGSLSVLNLGKIIPSISDNVDTIIPIGYVCSRLFWSTTEPWKLVPYKITTSVLNSQSQTHNDKNFTIDHMQPKQTVERKFKEVLAWQRDDKNEINEYDEFDPPNAVDILSPEITDAILEELPQDLLDGISVQDMLIECEELMSLDFKNAEINCNDSLSLNMNNDMKTDDFEESKVQTKKSKSDISPKKDDKLKARNQQRSCNLAWTQFDSSPVLKKRKITPNRDMFMQQLLQVDGNYDSSSSSECESPTHDSKFYWSSEVGENPVSCENCHCTYRTQASYKRHLASCESFTSESETEPDSIMINEGKKSQVLTYETYSSFRSSQNQIHSTVMNTHTLLSESTKVQENTKVYNNFQGSPSNIINLGLQNPHNHSNLSQHHTNPQLLNQYCLNQQNMCLNQNVNQPNLIIDKNVDNAQVLNTINSMALQAQTHALQTHPQQITIQPSQVTLQSQPQQITLQSPPQHIALQPQHMTIQSHPQHISSQPQMTLHSQPQQITLQTQPQQITLQSQPQQMTLQSQPQHLTLQSHASQMSMQSQPHQMSLQSQSPQISLQPVSYSQDVQPLINLNQQNLSSNLVNSVVNIPESQWMRTVVAQNKPRVRPRIVAKRNRMPIVLSQNSQPVIVQHIPTNMPFVDTSYQPQVNQNVQYVATLAPQMNSNLASQPQLLQLGDNNFLSIVPNVQPTMIIQQPRVDAGVTGQIIVDSNGSMMWASQPVPQVQPVFYGFETIVQNTVMQSQQLMPTTMPGVLTTNSSYSATTQVFQSSKLEPVMDGSYVLVNQNQLVNQQPQQSVHVPQIQSNITPQSVPVQNKPPNWNHIEVHQQPHQRVVKPPPQQQIKPIQETNSITLPPITAYVPDQGIPSKIVTPKPQMINQCRPMSRVLPMQTTTAQQKKTEKGTIKEEKAVISEEPVKKAIVEKHKVVILEEVIIKSPTAETIIQPGPVEIIKDQKFTKEEKTINNALLEILPKVEVATLPKVIKFDKENEEPEVLPKINNKVQIVPLKPIQTKLTLSPITSPLSLKENLPPNIPAEQENILPEPPIDEIYTKSLQKNYKKINNPSPANCVFYKIESPDGINYTATSLTQLWRKLYNEVQAARLAHNLPQLPDFALRTINDNEILGLKMKGMKYLLEQLPESMKCKSYKPVFRKWNNNLKDEEVEDEDGCRRTVVYKRKQEKYDMFGWLSSKHRVLEMYDYDSSVSKKYGSSSLPMAMRFRNLKITSKYSVGVYRSEIHGRGLFSLRDIEAGEMVIEYAGEVIRSGLTDIRENFYNSKGIGCYMFRVDDNLVVDATMKGNAARFINHSCDPNCYSKVVEILSCKHIIIFALRKIISGEELTYDYKFPFEEDKIPCTCGTKRCRKFLN